jgi:hypothetical protein
MDTEISVLDLNKPSFRQFLFQAFLGLTAMEGFACLIWFTRLPVSEAERAVLLGYSFTRLLVLVLFGGAVIYSAGLFLQALFLPEKDLRLQAVIRTWFANHDFLATVLVTCLAAWAVLGLGMEILLNPDWFPRSILYQFLYIRIRPIFLWTVLTGFQCFVLILANRWYELKKDALPAAHARRGRFAAIGLGALLFGNIALWLVRLLVPDLFDAQNSLILTAIILLGLLGVGLIIHLHRSNEISTFVDPTAEAQAMDRPAGGLKFTLAFGGIFLLMAAWYGISTYLVPPLADPNNMDRARLIPMIFGFGFNQLRWAPAWLVIGLALLLMAAMWFTLRYPGRMATMFSRATEYFYSRKIHLLLAALALTALFYTFRSQLISDDTLHFMNWMPNQAAHGITHVRFDEMFESNLHFEAYKLTNWLWGWNVQYTYNVISCLAGGIFIVFLLIFCRRLAGSKALALFAFLVSGGFMQLFFGDKENYTLAMTLLLVYFYFSYRYLKRETALTTPAFFLALAMMFHLEAAYLLPTLFYLTIVELQRRKYFTAAAAWLILVSIFSLTMAYFVFKGADWATLRDTSWGLGRGGNMLFNLVPPTGLMLYARLNMMALIFPPIAFLVPALLSGGLRRDHLTAFLVIAAVIGLFFTFVWISTIGYYSDWNLFSMPMFPAVLLLGLCLLRGKSFPFKNTILVGMVLMSIFASYTWIIHNHYLILN